MAELQALKSSGGSNPTLPDLYFVPSRKNSRLEDQGGVELQNYGASGSSRIVVNDDHESHEDGEGLYAQVAALGSWFGSLLPQGNNSYAAIGGQGSSAAKPRKVPVKVEPKVFFANERTFLAWLHMSVTLASISVAIVAFAEANRWSQLYGLMLMPCSIAFCAYSLWMYTKRAAMIRRKDPGPYEDLFGPIVLSSMLALSIIVNFFVKLYDYST